MSDTYCIYRHISPSGKVYIGQSKNIGHRWSGNGIQYLHKNEDGSYVQKVFARAILKYGWDNFKHEILLGGLDKSNADYAEIYLITWYKMHHISYNMADGGTGCSCMHHYTLEERKKISERVKANPPMKGKHHTPEAMAKIIAANRNRHYTEEQRERMRLNGKRVSSIPITEERRQKYRDYRKAHPETWVGGWNKKEVHQYDFQGNYIASYPSATEASLSVLGKDRTADICRCCNGDVASASGYIWRFVKVDYIDMTDYKVVYTTHGTRLYDMSEKGKMKRRISHGKPVNQYSLDGKYITTYNSTTEASENTPHTTSAAIGKCCNHSHKYKTSGGYRWEYDTGNNKKDLEVA